jgi:hypothetical protein
MSLSVVDGDDKVIINHNRYEAQKRGIRASLTKEPLNAWERTVERRRVEEISPESKLSQ